MRQIIIAAAIAGSLLAAPASAQYRGQLSNNPYAQQRYQPPPVPTYTAPKLYDQGGQYRGNLSNNRFDPNSVANPYGRYGSQYSQDSINNPYSPAGSRYSPTSPNNPYGQGVGVYGR